MSAIEKAIAEGLREEIVRAVGRHRYRLWFRDAVVRPRGEDAVTIAVPTELHRTWLESTYGPLLRRAVTGVLGEGARIDVEVSEVQGRKRQVRDRLPEDAQAWMRLLAARRQPPTLASFVCDGNDRFVPMLLSQLVHGSDDVGGPAIYLYGEPGTGKSHLLEALHDAVERASPGDAVALSSRTFTSRYIAALRARDLAAVQAFEVDLCHRRLVLIDDLHALARRPATQRALVRLRERALGTRTRFVFASRRHPHELSAFSGTLRSWLMGGIVLRLAPPTPDRLRRILAERAKAHGLDLPEPVDAWIREHTVSVPGAVEVLDRWAVASAELGRGLDAEWLPEIAPHVTATATDEIIRRAKRAVAAHYDVPLATLDVATKARRAALARRVGMYLVYRAAALPLARLGRAFGLRSHSSVCRAIAQVREARDRDPTFEQAIESLLVTM